MPLSSCTGSQLMVSDVCVFDRRLRPKTGWGGRRSMRLVSWVLGMLTRVVKAIVGPNVPEIAGVS